MNFLQRDAVNTNLIFLSFFRTSRVHFFLAGFLRIFFIFGWNRRQRTAKIANWEKFKKCSGQILHKSAEQIKKKNTVCAESEFDIFKPSFMLETYFFLKRAIFLF